MIFRKMLCLPVLVLATTSMMTAASTKYSDARECQVWDFEAETNKLLTQIKTLSSTLSHDASILESYNRQPHVSWQSHAQQLTKAKEHINAIGERLDQLQAIKGMAAPWQQEAIQRIVAVSSQLAEHTTAAIEHLNENRNYLYSPAYASHLWAISDQSDELKGSMKAFFEYRETTEQVDRMQQKLDALRERLDIS